MNKIDKNLKAGLMSRLVVGSALVGLTFAIVISSKHLGQWDIESVSAALLTPGEGILSASVKARASFVDSTDIKFKVKDGREEVIHVPDSAQTLVQEIVVAPNGHTGWHSHPGPVVVLIKSGTLSLYDGDDPTCSERTYAAGESFIDHGQGHAHIARNQSSVNLELWAVYFDVPVGGVFRLDVPDPGNCTFSNGL